MSLLDRFQHLNVMKIFCGEFRFARAAAFILLLTSMCLTGYIFIISRKLERVTDELQQYYRQENVSKLTAENKVTTEIFTSTTTEPANNVVPFHCTNNTKQQLFDPYKYHWTIIERGFCTKRYPGLFLLFIIHTASGNFKERMLIREMWGREEYYQKFKTAVIFAVGKSNDSAVNQLMHREAEKYGDLVQQDFIDTYRNLTLKAVMWIRFVAAYCPKIPYILKLDDDSMVNYFGLIQLLQTRSRPNSVLSFGSKTLACSAFPGTPVVRTGSKWSVSKEEYPNDAYPMYCYGWYFLLTGDLIRPMLHEISYCTFFWIDDVHVTGHIAERAQAQFENWDSASSFYPNGSEVMIGHKLFLAIRSIDERKRIWKEYLRQYGYDQDVKQ